MRKKFLKLITTLTVLLLLARHCFPVFAAETGLLSEDTPTVSENTLPAVETTVSENTLPAVETTASQNTLPVVEAAISENTLSDKAPSFTAKVQLLEAYVVKGTFTEYRDDISRIRILSSQDGSHYQECGDEWNLCFLGTTDPDELAALQTQICLYDRFEPLKSYVEGTIDRFYLKLEITLQNGSTYESETAVIDRGEPQPLPEQITLSAQFAPSISVIERRPLYCYGKYQLTVSPTATLEEIAALLPDTLPVKVNLHQGRRLFTDCIVDCPIRWKALSLPGLTAGESVTVYDAAEDIILPADTLLPTPAGNFRLEEPLALSQDIVTSDEIRLVFNVVAPDGNPTGVLSQETAGLEMAFDLKPTGAAAIHAYFFTEQAAKWEELPDLALTETVNTYPSAANSGYTLVLRNDQEPYRSYLEAEAAGSPSPFLIGLKIEGGIYHGRQLVLPWPSTYELPPHLPNVGGAGGNEGNAGSQNKDDSTDEGQRPGLPQTPETDPTVSENSTPTPETPPKRHGTRPDSSRPNQDHQKISPGQTANEDTVSNNGNASESDGSVSNTQTSVTMAELPQKNYADADAAARAPANASIGTVSLTIPPAEAAQPERQEISPDQTASPTISLDQTAPSVGQEEGLDQAAPPDGQEDPAHNQSIRHRQPILVTAAAVAAVCIIAVIVRINTKRNAVVK